MSSWDSNKMVQEIATGRNLSLITYRNICVFPKILTAVIFAHLKSLKFGFLTVVSCSFVISFVSYFPESVQDISVIFFSKYFAPEMRDVHGAKKHGKKKLSSTHGKSLKKKLEGLLKLGPARPDPQGHPGGRGSGGPTHPTHLSPGPIIYFKNTSSGWGLTMRT